MAENNPPTAQPGVGRQVLSALQSEQPVSPQTHPAVAATAGQSAPAAPAPNVPQQQLPAQINPVWGPDGRITRAGMETVIRGGGSVVTTERIQTGNKDNPVREVPQHYTSIDQLPSPAKMARNDDERAAVRAQLESQQKQLSDQLAELDQSAPKTAATATKK